MEIIKHIIFTVITVNLNYNLLFLTNQVQIASAETSTHRSVDRHDPPPTEDDEDEDGGFDRVEADYKDDRKLIKGIDKIYRQRDSPKRRYGSSVENAKKYKCDQASLEAEDDTCYISEFAAVMDGKRSKWFSKSLIEDIKDNQLPKENTTEAEENILAPPLNNEKDNEEAEESDSDSDSDTSDTDDPGSSEDEGDKDEEGVGDSTDDTNTNDLSSQTDGDDSDRNSVAEGGVSAGTNTDPEDDAGTKSSDGSTQASLEDDDGGSVTGRNSGTNTDPTNTSNLSNQIDEDENGQGVTRDQGVGGNLDDDNRSSVSSMDSATDPDTDDTDLDSDSDQGPGDGSISRGQGSRGIISDSGDEDTTDDESAPLIRPNRSRGSSVQTDGDNQPGVRGGSMSDSDSDEDTTDDESAPLIRPNRSRGSSVQTDGDNQPGVRGGSMSDSDSDEDTTDDESAPLIRSRGISTPDNDTDTTDLEEDDDDSPARYYDANQELDAEAFKKPSSLGDLDKPFNSPEGLEEDNGNDSSYDDVYHGTNEDLDPDAFKTHPSRNRIQLPDGVDEMTTPRSDSEDPEEREESESPSPEADGTSVPVSSEDEGNGNDGDVEDDIEEGQNLGGTTVPRLRGRYQRRDNDYEDPSDSDSDAETDDTLVPESETPQSEENSDNDSYANGTPAEHDVNGGPADDLDPSLYPDKLQQCIKNLRIYRDRVNCLKKRVSMSTYRHCTKIHTNAE